MSNITSHCHCLASAFIFHFHCVHCNTFDSRHQAAARIGISILFSCNAVASSLIHDHSFWHFTCNRWDSFSCSAISCCNLFNSPHWAAHTDSIMIFSSCKIGHEIMAGLLRGAGESSNGESLETTWGVHAFAGQMDTAHSSVSRQQFKTCRLYSRWCFCEHLPSKSSSKYISAMVLPSSCDSPNSSTAGINLIMNKCRRNKESSVSTFSWDIVYVLGVCELAV